MLGKRFLSALLCLCSSLALVVADSSAADSKGADSKTADSKTADSKTAPAHLTAAQIVDKHVAARGGLQAWRAVQALSVTGKMDAGSGDSTARAMKIARAPK